MVFHLSNRNRTKTLTLGIKINFIWPLSISVVSCAAILTCTYHFQNLAFKYPKYFPISVLFSDITSIQNVSNDGVFERRNVPHRLMYLNVWSPADGAVWGDVELLGG